MALKIYIMDEGFKVFDFYRIFIGEAPPAYLLEIVFRTIIMYVYTVFLLRVLGKRSMGQLSTLELAIIISFGSAVGDPMLGVDMPVLHGMTAITTITFMQIALERLINKNRKVETYMEGTANLVVDQGIIQWECMKEDSLSKEDLFRALRGKEVEHLGQVEKAFFETSGQISVVFYSPKKIKPGLSVLPETEIPAESISKATTSIEKSGFYTCMNCGKVESFAKSSKVPKCEVCDGAEWLPAKTG